jgi:hypothetical protein
MSVKLKLHSLDGLSEEIAALYKEENGVYILDVADTENLKDQNKANMIPKSRLDLEISKRKEAEKGLQAICDQMI